MLRHGPAREVFEASEDFTVGIEEEFASSIPQTRALVPRFGELRDAAQADQLLAESVAGELIQSRSRSVQPRDRPRRRRGAPARAPRRLFGLAARQDALLSATATHPWSPWQEQRRDRHRALPPRARRA